MVYLSEYRKLIEITRQEAASCSVRLSAVLGRGRTKGVVEARTRAIIRIRAELPLSLAEIGVFFRRDHTTILHALNK